ncbi:hypothetical protein PV326_011804, partial [Microctonus aethiopoides]
QQQHQAQQQQQQQQQQQPAQSSQHGQQLSQQVNSPACGNAGKASPLPTNSLSSNNNSTTNKSQGESKLVECSLCRRQFKNIPALNGHMRLHGGYFKKDGDNKKSEKKETPGPPLQTASVNVRALIEEKIIQKRTTVYNCGK